MIVKQDTFDALCINNIYEDFGSHTGFRHVTKVYNNLVIGKWYTFGRDEYGVYLLPETLLNNKFLVRANGYSFGIKEEGEHVDFYNFFSTIQAHRDRKIDEILNNK